MLFVLTRANNVRNCYKRQVERTLIVSLKDHSCGNKGGNSHSQESASCMCQPAIWNLRSSARSIRETERICEPDIRKELCRTMTYGSKVPWIQ